MTRGRPSVYAFRVVEQRIPFVKVELDEADIAAVERVLRSGWQTTASQVKALEAELAAYTGARRMEKMVPTEMLMSTLLEPSRGSNTSRYLPRG